MYYVYDLETGELLTKTRNLELLDMVINEFVNQGKIVDVMGW